MEKYTLYLSERIITEFDKLTDETKGEFIRKAVHFYLDYHGQVEQIIAKLNSIENIIANGNISTVPVSDDAIDDDSITDILNM